MTMEILFWTLMKTDDEFFKIDPCYPKVLAATFLNYMNQRQEENEKYDLTSQI